MTEELKALRLDRELIGHQSGIECLALSTDGLTLLSGDDDALVIIWNLTTGEINQKISCLYNGPISAMAWIDNINDSSEPVFVFGCADGSLHLYRRKSDGVKFEFVSMETYHNGAIESLAFDPLHCRLASVGGGVPQVWKLSAAGTMTPVIDPGEQRSVVARNVFFCDDGASIVVCYLESHEIICFSIEPWSVKWSKSVPTRIGNSFLCSADGLYLFVTNLVNGVDQYRFPSLEKVQSFPHAIETNHPLQVSTVAKGVLVVCGGDNGFARIFNRRTGQLIQRLEHEKSKKHVPAIATCALANGSVVVTGESGEGECKIRLWKEEAPESVSTISTTASSPLSVHARLSSGLTGMQAIAFGLISMVVWHFLVGVVRMLLDLGEFSLLLKKFWRIFKFALPFLASYRPDAPPEPSVSSPSVVVITQTSFATVTSVFTTLVMTSSQIPLPVTPIMSATDYDSSGNLDVPQL